MSFPPSPPLPILPSTQFRIVENLSTVQPHKLRPCFQVPTDSQGLWDPVYVAPLVSSCIGWCQGLCFFSSHLAREGHGAHAKRDQWIERVVGSACDSWQHAATALGCSWQRHTLAHPFSTAFCFWVHASKCTKSPFVKTKNTKYKKYNIFVYAYQTHTVRNVCNVFLGPDFVGPKQTCWVMMLLARAMTCSQRLIFALLAFKVRLSLVTISLRESSLLSLSI